MKGLAFLFMPMQADIFDWFSFQSTNSSKVKNSPETLNYFILSLHPIAFRFFLEV